MKFIANVNLPIFSIRDNHALQKSSNTQINIDWDNMDADIYQFSKPAGRNFIPMLFQTES
jgi:hypothetical protein